MEDATKYSSIYNGHRILLSTSVMLFVAAGIFTHVIRTILQCIFAILIIAFAVGISVNADKLKLNGWKKKRLCIRLLLIPIFAGFVLLMLTNIPLIYKSILSGIATAISLLIIKPSKKKGTMQ